MHECGLCEKVWMPVSMEACIEHNPQTDRDERLASHSHNIQQAAEPPAKDAATPTYIAKELARDDSSSHVTAKETCASAAPTPPAAKSPANALKELQSSLAKEASTRPAAALPRTVTPPGPITPNAKGVIKAPAAKPTPAAAVALPSRLGTSKKRGDDGTEGKEESDAGAANDDASNDYPEIVKFVHGIIAHAGRDLTLEEVKKEVAPYLHGLYVSDGVLCESKLDWGNRAGWWANSFRVAQGKCTYLGQRYG